MHLSAHSPSAAPDGMPANRTPCRGAVRAFPVRHDSDA